MVMIKRSTEDDDERATDDVVGFGFAARQKEKESKALAKANAIVQRKQRRAESTRK